MNAKSDISDLMKIAAGLQYNSWKMDFESGGEKLETAHRVPRFK